VLYALAVGLTSLTDTALDLRVRRHAVLEEGATLEPVGLPVGVVFLATVPVAWWSPALARSLWLAAIPWAILSGRWATRRSSAASHADPEAR
jgi:hypothetical protein